MRRVVTEEGIGAFYASYRTTAIMNAPFTAVHFATYEAAKRELMDMPPNTVNNERLIVHATAGAGAGALATAVTTPLDRVCGCDKFSSGSIRNVIETIMKKDGYRGLMRGGIPRTLFHAPAAAICWPTYETSKSFFQRVNIG
ncbi:laccase-3-like [Hibiscus syriacus]|uniref:Laccase-3-like n=1 Tax=Hibiscus syriacus TaxID=106335 RepID=A0A6A3A3I2_HIBSY|nr:laccase-3-like [Hibiscus syriacus]